MLAKRILSIALLLGGLLLNAQNFTIKGKVVDSNNLPMEFATVSIQVPEVFDIVEETLTDQGGNFSMQVPKGDFVIYIETFGGDTFEKDIKITKNENLGNFIIKVESVALEGAVLTGNTQAYRMDLDKKVYDMSQDATAKGASLSEALENVPSVTVDGEGNVSLRGNENVRILIDGKPSPLIGSDPAQALKNLPADLVDRVEVVTNPSARYEAEGSAGILNIVLKKGKLKGLNGSVSVSGGIPETAGVNVNLNYRKGKWNHFTNLGYRYSEWENERRSRTTRYDALGVPRYENMDGKGEWIRNGYNLLFGTEYYMDDKNTFTISGSFNKNHNNNISDLQYLDFDADRNQTAASERRQREKGDRYSVEGNFGFRHQFDNDGHELTFDAKGSYSDQVEDGFFTELGDFVDSKEKALNKEYQHRIILSADYVRPLANKGRLEIGARTEMASTLTDFKVDSLAGDNWMDIARFDNRVDNRQNVYAAYVQYGRAFGQFSFLAGMRMENSDVSVNSIHTETKVDKNYTDFFPSLFLNYEFLNQDQLQVSYSRRVRRPRGWDLIPYSSYSDNRMMRMGNPDLNPQYTDSFELSYVGKFGKLMLTPSVYYSKTHDNIQRYQTINNDGMIIARPINVGTDERFGGELTFTYRPTKWWNLMGNVNLFGYETKGSHTDTFTNQDGEVVSRTTNFDGDGFSWFGRLSNSFTLPAKFSAQISGMYRAGNKTSQMERKPMYGADFSLSKDLFNDNATLSFSIRDIFNTRKMRMNSWGEDFNIENTFRWSVRSYNLSFAYRFNQSKRDQRRMQRDQQMNGDSEMEQMPM